MGQQKGNEVLMAHPSISRIHAAIISDQDQSVFIVDLGSKGGTFVNGNNIDEYVGREIKYGDVITFA